MYSYSPNFQQFNYTTTFNAKPKKVEEKPEGHVEIKRSYHTNVMKDVPFNPTFSASQLRTRLTTEDEKSKYNQLVKISDKQTRKNLDSLLKKGILLNADSNDKTSVLDSLYKIATTPRANGLNAGILVSETVATLNDPYKITQEFGDIPKEFENDVISAYKSTNSKAPSFTAKNKANVPAETNVEHSGTCVAASEEFNLAQKMPAEFARFAEGLSSPNMQVQKSIKLANLADNTLDAVWLLNAFEIPYEMKDFNNAKLTFAPDKNAIIRAKIQTVDKDPHERSCIDVLMQSTLMQVGSQQSYDSLTDKRQGKFNQNDKGLIEFEKTFTESVLEDKNKISVTYQTVDENAKLVGYETDMTTMKRQLVDTLDKGENVIIGYTQVDNNNIIINGHEITIVGYKKNNDGKLTFICNDTDDGMSKAIKYSEDYLLPKIHHAALPHDIVQNDVKMVENWVEGLNSYKELKKQQTGNTPTAA